MVTNRIIPLLLSLILYPLCTIAQSSYYYYKGNKIYLNVNSEKACVNIPKARDYTCEAFLKQVKVFEKIKDEVYDIFVVQNTDVKSISTWDFYNETSSSMFVSPCYRTMDSIEVYSSPYLHVRLKRERDKDLLSSYATKYGLKIIKKDTLLPLWYILSVSANTELNALEAANALWESGEFAEAVPDLCANNIICSNDPMFNQQWGLLNNNYTGIDISASPAWNYSTGKNINIAFLDTGIDLEHIDLAANICDLSYDTETYSSPSHIYHEHGTHCAGIAAAIKDNGVHIAGVAPDATITSISSSMNEFATNIQLKLANGIVWAYQHGVDIISNSWYYPTPHPAISEAIYDAFNFGRNGKGCIIVFSSGNNYCEKVAFPANCNDTILAVGAINILGARADFSTYGTELDVVAPGVNILSTIPGNQTSYKDGTSMACPHVAGVAALILERNPELTVTQVNRIINSNAKKLTNVNFDDTKPYGCWNHEYGYGLVDAYSSVLNTPHFVYIQNDTITGTETIAAERIYVGRDVAATKTPGAVLLGRGNITLRAGFVEIKNSTFVPLGATLTITNN